MRDVNTCPLCAGRNENEHFCDKCQDEIDAPPADLPVIGEHLKRMRAIGILLRSKQAIKNAFNVGRREFESRNRVK
jgi:hypothetical protein